MDDIVTVTVTPKIYWGLNQVILVNASGPREAGKLEVLRVVV